MLDCHSSFPVRSGRAGCLLVILHICAATLLPAAAPAANRDALRQIVQDQCTVHWREQHDALPCERVSLPEAPNENAGFAVLHDIKGGAHFLLIPTKTIAGMESAELFEPGTPNYFAAAWRSRDLVADAAGHTLRRGMVGLALNPRHARSQDQLHIHIECVRIDVAKDLRAAARQISETWSPQSIGSRRFSALRILGEELDDANPFELLAKKLPAEKSALGDYTLILVGMDYLEGPGFVLLASSGPAGELLLDSSCAIATTLL